MAKLVWRNLLRNKRRTFLTVASLAVALLLLSLLNLVLAAMTGAETANAHRVVVRNAISLTFSLPKAYEQRLRTLEHVEAVTFLNWFQGTYKDRRPENMFPRFGTDPETLLGVFPEFEIGEAEVAAWKAERTAFIAGRALAEQQGWKIGDRITIKGDIYPMTLDLTLRGIFSEPNDPGAERVLYFHWRYAEEAMGNPGIVGTYWLLLDSPDSVTDTIASAEAMFVNSADQVRAESEEAFVLSFLEMMGNVRFLFTAIGLAIVVSIFFITANTMAMAARERTTEVAVLRTLGFRRSQVMAIVISESLGVGLLGAALGCLLVVGLLAGLSSALQESGFLFTSIQFRPQTVGFALGIGALIGVVSGLFPAVTAARLRIVDGLRRVV